MAAVGEADGVSLFGTHCSAPLTGWRWFEGRSSACVRAAATRVGCGERWRGNLRTEAAPWGWAVCAEVSCCSREHTHVVHPGRFLWGEKEVFAPSEKVLWLSLSGLKIPVC